MSPREVGSIRSQRSAAAEANAGVTFLQLLHTSFPGASLNECGDDERAVMEMLLDNGPEDVPLVCNRKFHLRDFPTPFQAARAAFIASTLDPAKPAAHKGIFELDFGPKAKYASRGYEMVEADCIVKLPAGLGEWACDPSSNPADRPLFVARAEADQALPELQPVQAVREASAISHADEAAAMAQLEAARSDDLTRDSEEAVGSGHLEGTASGIDEEATSVSFSDQYYPRGSTMYVMAELFHPIVDGGADEATEKRAADKRGRHLSAKLLQAERTLQFLKFKEQKADVRDCVLGMVFMGPEFDSALVTKVFYTLENYKDILPCLWALQQPPHRRLLCLKVVPAQPAVGTARVLARVDRLGDRVDGLGDRMNEGFDEMRKLLAGLQAGMHQKA